MNIKIAIGVALAGAFALGATLVAVSSATSDTNAATNDGAPATSFSDQQEDEIRALVYDYLMENPEVIIEAVNRYSQNQQQIAQTRAAETAKKRLASLLDPAGGYVAGANADGAKIAVIEFSDYHCGYCKRAAPIVNDIIKKQKDVKVVFREFPILREESDLAAEMALAARAQGKFLDMHFAMMKAQGVLTEARIADIAKKEGVDFAALKKARKDAEVSAAIVETVDIAREMGIDGTPAFVVASVDGAYVDVVQGFNRERLMASIKEARAAVR